jgi:hypothetical protein
MKGKQVRKREVKRSPSKINQSTFQKGSSKISILEQDDSIYLFQSPKKENLEFQSPPKNNNRRTTLAQKISMYGY